MRLVIGPKNLWSKLAYIGFSVVLAVNILWPVLVIMLPIATLTPLAIITSLMLFGEISTLLIYLYVFATCILFLLLKRRIEYPLTVAIFAGVIFCSIHFLVYKLMPPVGLASSLAGSVPTLAESFRPVFTGLLLAFVGALILPFLYFIANTIHNSSKRFIILLLIAATSCTVAVLYPEKPFILLSQPRVNEVSWQTLPETIPSWLKEYGSLYQDSCSMEPVYGLSWYECDYYFTNFPGYLSKESQLALSNGIEQRLKRGAPSSNDNYAPSPFFSMTVVRDNPQFNIYKFKNGKCDWTSLKEAATALRNSDGKVAERFINAIPSEPKRCASVRTPAGKELYYDSYLNYPEHIVAQVPVHFYFMQNDTLVLLAVNYPNIVETGTLTSLYLTDANFQHEVLKFVDSFK